MTLEDLKEVIFERCKDDYKLAQAVLECGEALAELGVCDSDIEIVEELHYLLSLV